MTEKEENKRKVETAESLPITADFEKRRRRPQEFQGTKEHKHKIIGKEGTKGK